MKRVLFLDSHRHIVGGGQLSLVSLAAGLDKGRFEAICVCPDGGNFSEAARSALIPVVPLEQPSLRLRSLFRVVTALWRLCRVIGQNKVDVVHANGSRSMLYAGISGRICSVPVIWHVRVCPSDGFLDNVLVKLCSGLIVISRAVQERFARLFSEKIHLVYNGVDLDQGGKGGTSLRRLLGYDEVPLVGMVAQLVPVKRHQDFRLLRRICG